MMTRLECAREKVEKANLGFGNHIRVESAEIDGKRSAANCRASDVSLDPVDPIVIAIAPRSTA